jgi:hypothetical protein
MLCKSFHFASRMIGEGKVLGLEKIPFKKSLVMIVGVV